MLTVKKHANHWTNWTGNVQSQPKQIAMPKSVDEVVQLVLACKKAGTRIRVVGSGHSFTRLVQTEDCLLSLDHLQGIVSVDPASDTVEVWAGTKLKTLGQLLHQAGYSQENLGDINAQSIAGAVSTGTHGTGIHFGSISTQVVGLTVVTASGEVLEVSEQAQPDLFKAMQVSLGLLGIIVRVKLRVLPAYRLRYQSRRMQIEECLSSLETFKTEHRHFEFFIFPYSDTVQVKFMNETSDPPSGNQRWSYLKKMVVENGLFWLLSESCRLRPSLTKSVSRLSAQSVPSVHESGYSHQLFATPRLVRFYEMEYCFPAEHMGEAIRELRKAIEQERFAVHFPLECRYVKKDDIWLSPAYERDSAFIAVHMYKGMPYEAYFAGMEEIFARYGGRPHWGKMHSMTTEKLHQVYPRLPDFLAIRSELDPDGLFVNPYLAELFGIS
ncbi:putative FAD-dependent oxidoreductase [Brevibacillus brevis NBRC 100599]|uniref:Putative FAD-dependent oxidoreductase n=1 Tax=Brevibacillus brevis (strain 47 / JCM 6285 / NBRC 100599) TaxID=358681 RepID=C0Z8D0_BREBN|nr:D-arabinono-1,4-lactone oxidase [Brevibacillus brevis]BAH46557.1 putative FAD-dependent oxidoreductase [Brevibacillus brevis NBRC 100599]